MTVAKHMEFKDKFENMGANLVRQVRVFFRTKHHINRDGGGVNGRAVSITRARTRYDATFYVSNIRRAHPRVLSFAGDAAR